MKKNPRLHIFLGAGGVGKTTLSSAYAVYLASLGKKTGLLSIDPAKRLKSALGAKDIGEAGKIFWKRPDGKGHLRAAILNLPDSLRRWIIDEGLSEEHQKQLFHHPLYRTLAEKVASATETLAPIRMAEWIEQYPDTEELIIDTAPGLHAVDFITRPDKLLAFFDSKILQWIKWFAGEKKWVWVDGKKQILQDQNFFQKLIRTGTKSILSALGKVGGENILLSLGELIVLMDQVFYKMVERLEESRKWIRDENTTIHLVFSLRDDAVSVAIELKEILEKHGIVNCSFLLNQSIPDTFLHSQSLQEFLKKEPEDELISFLQKYIQAFPGLKAMVYEKLSKFRIRSIKEIPFITTMEEIQEFKISDLLHLGSYIDSQEEVLLEK